MAACAGPSALLQHNSARRFQAFSKASVVVKPRLVNGLLPRTGLSGCRWPVSHTARTNVYANAAGTSPSFPTPASPGPSGVEPSSSNNAGKLLLGIFGTAAAAAAAVYFGGYWPAVQNYLQTSGIAASGFFASLSLIFLSELGDKTFFICALLAMKLGNVISFLGTMTALSVMTFISVGIGYAFKHVPEALTTSVPIGEYLGVALMVYFGVRTLKDALTAPAEEEQDGGELSDAKEEVAQAEKGGKITAKTTALQSFFEVTSLIFVAEWGDRSMLATIALGAAQSPVGVATGAIMGHALATVIAVLGGAVASKYISERTINFIGGILFLVFAVVTVLGVF